VRAPQLAPTLALTLASLTASGCNTPAPSDAGTDAQASSDAAPDAVTDAGNPCEAEVTPESCRPSFAGLASAVEIIRDQDGVPHVYAANNGDAYFASGYAQATDRMLQMELSRRRALGRSAEVLGEGAAGDDILMRTVGIAHWGEVNASLIAREDPSQYVLLDAWVRGVNRRIEEVRAGTVPMPSGFGATELATLPESWTVGHALAVGKLLLFGNANQIEFDILASVLRRYFPDVFNSVPLFLPMRDAHTMPPEERPRAFTHAPGIRTFDLQPAQPSPLPPDAAERMASFFARRERSRGLSIWGGASNNWAIAGRHAENGRPIIAGDPHQGFSSPNIFWMHHIHTTDATAPLDVIGWNFTGAPGVQLGHNRHIAWTATTTYPDTQDLWAVRIVGGMANIGGMQVPVRTHVEEVRIRDAAPRMVEITEVPGYGVILPGDIAPLPIVNTGEELLYRWTGFMPTREAQGFAAINSATNVEEFERAVDMMEIASFNFIAADADAIAYRSSMVVPVRRTLSAARPPWAVLNASEADSLWSDMNLPLTMLPHSRGGARGFLATANNEPFGFTEQLDLTTNPYYFGAFFDPGTRAQRIDDELTRLTERGDVSASEMATLQDDSVSLLAEDLVPALLAAWDARATDADLAPYRTRTDLASIVEQLRSWDRRMEREASAPVPFNAYAFFLTRAIFADEFGPVFDVILGGEAMYMLRLTALTITNRITNAATFVDGPASLAMIRALEETASYLSAQFGGLEPTRYTWGAIHGARFNSVYGAARDGGWIPSDGSHGTVNVSNTSFFDGTNPRTRLDATGGSVYRMVAGFNAEGVPEAVFDMPRGVSGEPGNAFYNNLQTDWQETAHRPLRFERADVEMGSVETVRLTP
jgi:penicillin amidase